VGIVPSGNIAATSDAAGDDQTGDGDDTTVVDADDPTDADTEDGDSSDSGNDNHAGPVSPRRPLTTSDNSAPHSSRTGEKSTRPAEPSTTTRDANRNRTTASDHSTAPARGKRTAAAATSGASKTTAQERPPPSGTKRSAIDAGGASRSSRGGNISSMRISAEQRNTLANQHDKGRVQTSRYDRHTPGKQHSRLHTWKVPRGKHLAHAVHFRLKRTAHGFASQPWKRCLRASHGSRARAVCVQHHRRTRG
jgi:hypothetical protein